MKRCHLFYLLLTLICQNVEYFAQQFVDKTFELGIDHTYGIGQAGGGLSCADFNGDGWDDITLGSSKNQPIYFYQNMEGKKFKKLDLLPDMTDDVKSIMWVDFDNDGDQDLYFTTANSRNRLYENRGNLDLKEISLEVGFPDEDLTSFGACWGDYNRDGLLDVYYGERRLQFIGKPNRSFLFKNLGNKKFIDVTELTNTIDDNGKTQFCSSFIDYDNDKWLDIYTAQDRRRGNTLLRNNGKGMFDDVSATSSADIYMDGMSVSYGDVNHDGYLDIYISNTDEGNVLLINIEGKKFENQASKYGVTFNGVAWGTNFLDGDCDGDQDLYVSSMLPGRNNNTSKYYRNEGVNTSFTKMTTIPSDTVSSFSNGVGDFNHDGYPDIVTSNSEFKSLVFINKGEQNNYIGLRLQGKKSNRNGIGTHIIIETPDGNKQRFLTACGQGYLAQNSYTNYIGLGKNNSARITLIWSTGHMDVFNITEINKIFTFTEGQSTNGNIKLDDDLAPIYTETEDDFSIEPKIYPNPSEGEFKIENVKGDYKVEIYNFAGKLINKYEYITNDQVFKINQNGMYLVKVMNDSNKKIVESKIQIIK